MYLGLTYKFGRTTEPRKSSRMVSPRPLLGQGDLEVSIEGLEYMNDDPGEVDVLYAKVQEHSGRLQVWR